MAKRTKTSTKTTTATAATSLPTVQATVAGIDIGSSQHWVCGPARGEDGKPAIRSFGTTTVDLGALADWLVAQGTKSAAMESTSVYWSCGLLRGSFRPSEAISRLRALQRQMGNLVAERSRCVQWMQKSLDQMNVQVHRAVTDLTGKTGMAIVRAIIAGERDPARLAVHRDGRCRKSADEIAKYLTGHWREDHLFNLASALRIYDVLEDQIATYDARLMQELQALHPPERQDQPVPRHPNAGKEKAIKARGDQTGRLALWRFSGCDLTRIDGISAGTAQIVLTEIGPTLRHSRRRTTSFPGFGSAHARPSPAASHSKAPERPGRQPHRGSASHGSHLPAAQQDRTWRGVPADRPPQGWRSRRLRHRP